MTDGTIYLKIGTRARVEILAGAIRIGQTFKGRFGESSCEYPRKRNAPPICPGFSGGFGDSSGEYADVLQSAQLIILHRAIIMHFVQLQVGDAQDEAASATVAGTAFGAAGV